MRGTDKAGLADAGIRADTIVLLVDWICCTWA
jgi:hypothetical protein